VAGGAVADAVGLGVAGALEASAAGEAGLRRGELAAVRADEQPWHGLALALRRRCGLERARRVGRLGARARAPVSFQPPVGLRAFARLAAHRHRFFRSRLLALACMRSRVLLLILPWRYCCVARPLALPAWRRVCIGYFRWPGRPNDREGSRRRRRVVSFAISACVCVAWRCGRSGGL